MGEAARFENTASIRMNGNLRLQLYNLIHHDVLHFHRSIEIGLCVSGTGFSENCGVRRRFGPGDVFLSFPFQQHRNYSDSSEECVWNWTFIEPMELCEMTGNNLPVVIELMRKVTLYGLIRREEHPQIVAQVEDVFHSIDEGGSYCLARTYARLILLLLSLAERREDGQNAVCLPKRFDCMLLCLNTINARLADGRQTAVSELAEACGISVAGCRRLFQEILHMPPKQYVLSCAIQSAQVYLTNTDLSAGEIAERTGFSGAPAFCRAFASATGVTPSAFRKSSRR